MDMHKIIGECIAKWNQLFGDVPIYGNPWMSDGKGGYTFDPLSLRVQQLLDEARADVARNAAREKFEDMGVEGLLQKYRMQNR